MIERTIFMTNRRSCDEEYYSRIVNEEVFVEADVTITPDVSVGPVRSFCNGEICCGPIDSNISDTCSFTVCQKLCVQIPLTFTADATADAAGCCVADCKRWREY